MSSRKAEFWKTLQAAKLQVKQSESEGDLRRDMFYASKPGPPDIDFDPTPSSDRSNPRTAAMQYWQDQQVMRISWGDGGTPYLYYDVSPDEARRFTKVTSPGRFVNGTLNMHAYGKDQ